MKKEHLNNEGKIILNEVQKVYQITNMADSLDDINSSLKKLTTIVEKQEANNVIIEQEETSTFDMESFVFYCLLVVLILVLVFK
jgi:hypothetical protein